MLPGGALLGYTCWTNSILTEREKIIMVVNKTPRIAIIGAGPGGLTLARILQTRNISATVFERESDPNERAQGGSLDLHPESGQLALHLAGLDDQFQTIARYEDQGMRLLSKEGQVLLGDGPNQGAMEGDRPEVDRTALRAILLDSLASGVVRWGQNLRSIQQVTDGSYTLLFESGSLETFDMVVGADGAWSRVRPLVSDAIPTYTGVTFIEFGLDDVDQKHSEVASIVGHGTMFALANNKGLLAQRNGHGHIRVYAALRTPEKEGILASFDAKDARKARAWLLEQFPDWAPSLLGLIHESADRFVLRPLYMLPVGHRWDFRAGVTLLGDAAHLMSPFSGEGVNLAMLDAAELANAIGDCDNLEEAIQTYEKPMFARAEIVAKGAERGLSQAIAPDAPDPTLAFLREVMSDENSLGVFPALTSRESFDDGLVVRTDMRGKGRPMLVLHGAGGPQSVAGFVKALSKVGHVIAPTHPGFSGEPRPDWFTSVDDLAITYLALLEKLDLKDVIVIGFSFGGWVASEVAVRNRNSALLGGLILVDAAGIQVEGHEMADMFSRNPGAPPMRGNQPPASPPPGPVQAEERAANFRALAVYGKEQRLRDPKLRRRLAGVKTPVLVVWGENDPIVDVDYGRAYAESFPNARFELISGAGHFPQMDQPERLFDLAKGFVESVQV